MIAVMNFIMIAFSMKMDLNWQTTHAQTVEKKYQIIPKKMIEMYLELKVYQLHHYMVRGQSWVPNILIWNNVPDSGYSLQDIEYDSSWLDRKFHIQ